MLIELLLTFALPAAPPPTATERPNIVVLMFDTLRVSYLDLYGAEPSTMPFLKQLGERGTVIERGYSSSSWTAPSTASLFTGLYPTRHGVTKGFLAQKVDLEEQGTVNLNLTRLRDDQPTMPELLKAAGYKTFGTAANLNIGTELGFDRGFDHFRSYNDIDVNILIQDAVEWKPLMQGEEPFFLYMHFNDPHRPYRRRQPWFKKRVEEVANLRSAYSSELSYLDSKLRAIFRRMEWDENTIYILASDHGEEFMDHGRLEHTASLYTELNHVLMVFGGGPFARKPQRIDAPASLVDLLPTVLELAQIETDLPLNGRSLIHLIEGADDPEVLQSYRDRMFFAHRRGRGVNGRDLWGVMHGRWKLLHEKRDDKRQLFDMQADPLEQTDVAAQNPEVVARLMRALEQFRADSVQSAEVDVEMDQKLLDALEALGYAGDDDEDEEE